MTDEQLDAMMLGRVKSAQDAVLALLCRVTTLTNYDWEQLAKLRADVETTVRDLMRVRQAALTVNAWKQGTGE